MGHPDTPTPRPSRYAVADPQPEHFIPVPHPERARRIVERVTREWPNAPRTEGL